MVLIVDFDYYQNRYYGDQIKDDDDFIRRMRDAQAFLDRVTFGAITEQDSELVQIVRGVSSPLTDNQAEAVKMGLCKLCETLQGIETASQRAQSGASAENIKSVSSGGESVTYDVAETAYTAATKSPAVRQQLCREALTSYMRPHLFTVNPFYAGVR